MKIIEKIAKKSADIFTNPPVTIAFLGDSVTQGCFELYRTNENTLQTVFDYESSIARNLEKMLHFLYTSAQVNVINSGISGDSAVGGLSRFDRDIAPFHPDLVIVGYALNDCGGGDDGLEIYKSSLRAIFTKISELGAEAIFLTPNMMNTEVSCHIKDQSVKELAPSFAELQNNGNLDKYAEAGKKTAEENGVVVCDVYAKWKAMQRGGIDTTNLLANHLNHPVREMNKMTAGMILDAMLTK